jgi:heme exporter protein D
MSEFFDMGGYGAFIWPSYGIAALVMVGLVVASLRSLRANETRLAALEAEKEKWSQESEDWSSTPAETGQPT